MKINIKRISEDLNIKYNEARWNCMQGVYDFCITSRVNGRFRYAFDELKYLSKTIFCIVFPASIISLFVRAKPILEKMSIPNIIFFNIKLPFFPTLFYLYNFSDNLLCISSRISVPYSSLCQISSDFIACEISIVSPFATFMPFNLYFLISTVSSGL